ncbi:uncharacterized protein LOC133817720 [Humulus lupulus]|uniref:uncharacterized protein LOC133817720 n=1 Tax=Humulus lupulus TaxID=3486 RepID=UPI002B409AEC|nr:uncharacterized protein LOC133817720 [Humulus lupulus]
MFDLLFGWRKASKCKKLIKQLQCRLKLLKNKRHAIVRQLREDLAQLIKIGRQSIAFHRVEQLIKDETVNEAYELLEIFCDFILIQLSYIRRHKECPNDINEAISTLIYASVRCGDLPELRMIRQLFEDRYGHKFAMVALELFPGNLVNRQVKEKLSTQSISEDLKHRMVNEIARDYCPRPEILALEYYSDWEKQQMKLTGSEDQALSADVPTFYDISERSELHASKLEKVVFVDSPCHSKSIQDLNIPASAAAASSSSSEEQKVLPTILESQAQKEENSDEGNSQHGKGNLLGKKEDGRSATASSSESLPKFYEDTVVYMDDIEEFQSSTPKDEESQDQRLFRFKSSIQFKESSLNDRDELENEKVKSNSQNSGRTSSFSSKKRTRRKLVFHENESIKDTNSLSYYGQQPSNKQRSYHQQLQRKQQKKTSVDEGDKRPNQLCNTEMGFTFLPRNRRCYPKKPECRCCSSHNMRHSCSSLESPCYFFADEDDDDCDSPSFRKPKNLSSSHYSRDHNGETDEEVESIISPQKPRRRSYESKSMVYDVFTYPDHQIQSQNYVLEEKEERFGSRWGNGVSCRTRKDSVPPYIRTVTMPPERPKDISDENFQRSKSFPIQTPNHVHPKLPDYDDIAAKFTALKKERSCQ